MEKTILETKKEELKKELLNGKKLLKNEACQLGRIITKYIESGEIDCSLLEQAKKLIENYGSFDKKPDFKPPAFCPIISCSRPLDEWPLSIMSKNLQNFIYNLNKDDFNKLFSKKYVEIRDKKVKTNSKEFHNLLQNKYGVDLKNCKVQAVNKILDVLINNYKGVEKRIDKYNEKHKNDKDFIPKEVYDSNGYLIEKPGDNNNIFCYQQISSELLDCQLDKNIVSYLANEYHLYSLEPSSKISHRKSLDRLSVKKGEPGYIPSWQIEHNIKHYGFKVKNKGRLRQRYGEIRHLTNDELKIHKNKIDAQHIILMKIVVDDDWVVFDGRGLLRNMFFRNLVKNAGLSYSDILSFFTGDPTIDLKNNRIQFSYKQGKVPVVKQKTIKYSQAPKKLREIIGQSNKRVALVSIDLGQRNPATYLISKIYLEDNEFKTEWENYYFLNKDDKLKLNSYRESYDEFKNDVHKEAVGFLTAEQQQEIKSLEINKSTETKNILCDILNISADFLPWEQMGAGTSYISKYINNNNIELEESIKNKIMYKDKKTNLLKFKKDDKVAASLCPKLTEQTREVLSEKKWELLRNHEKFKKLSKRKLEIVRSIVNNIIKQAKKETGCSDVILNIEGLNVTFFNGRGKRELGWDNFFLPKKENRWFINTFHKVCSDLANDKGMIVIECRPNYTSQTCVDCGYCDKKNRDEERFECQKCKYECNADVLATYNLKNVALSGKALLGPKIERSGSEQKAGASRKCKSLKPKNNSDSVVDDAA